jgi:hypothetical protein
MRGSSEPSVLRPNARASCSGCGSLSPNGVCAGPTRMLAQSRRTTRGCRALAVRAAPTQFFSIVLSLEGNDWFLRLPRLRRRTSVYAVLTVRLDVALRPPPSSARRYPGRCTSSPASV